MVSVRYNRPSTFTIKYVGGKHSQIDLHPGINLNFPASELKALRSHPVWMAMLTTREIEILNYEPTSQGEKEGFEVVEDKKTGQPMPIQDTNVDEPIVQGPPQEQEPKPQVLVDGPIDGVVVLSSEIPRDRLETDLIALPGIGKVTATRILDAMPFESLDQVKAASELNDAAWEQVEPRISI